MAGPFAANPRRVVLLVAGVAVVAGGIGWGVGTQVQSPADAAASHRPPSASLVTASVERKTLRSTVVAQGTVAYGTPTPVQLTGTVGGTEGTQLITKAPTAGTTLRQGDVLLEVSGRPVFVLPGAVPMYRTLGLQSKGDDVKQLQKVLRALGHGSSVTGTFDAQTLAAVKKMYTKAGYEMITTAGEPPVTTVPSGEILFMPKLPVRLDAVTAKAGAAATGQIGTVTDSIIVIHGTLPAGDAKLLRAGLAATLKLPDGNDVPGKLDALGKDAAPPAAPVPSDAPQTRKPSDQDESAAATPLRVTADNPSAVEPFSGQAVKVTIELATTGGDVLTVPVAAVVTGVDGRARVRVEAGDGAVHDVSVALGLTALGAVQVTPEGGGVLNVGDRVVVGTS